MQCIMQVKQATMLCVLAIGHTVLCAVIQEVTYTLNCASRIRPHLVLTMDFPYSSWCRQVAIMTMTLGHIPGKTSTESNI